MSNRNRIRTGALSLLFLLVISTGIEAQTRQLTITLGPAEWSGDQTWRRATVTRAQVESLIGEQGGDDRHLQVELSFTASCVSELAEIQAYLSTGSPPSEAALAALPPGAFKYGTLRQVDGGQTHIDLSRGFQEFLASESTSLNLTIGSIDKDSFGEISLAATTSADLFFHRQ